MPADMADEFVVIDVDTEPVLIPLALVRMPDMLHMYKNAERAALAKAGFGGGYHPVTKEATNNILATALFQFARLHASTHLFRDLTR